MLCAGWTQPHESLLLPFGSIGNKKHVFIVKIYKLHTFTSTTNNILSHVGTKSAVRQDLQQLLQLE